MTPEDIKQRVIEISNMLDDCEGAHIAEDNLHQSVLRAIRDGQCDDPAACAGAALETFDLAFDRWFA